VAPHVLITGAAGFIGSTLSARLLDAGYRVTGLDAFTDAYPVHRKERNVAGLVSRPNYRLVRGDIRDASALTAAFGPDQPDVVVHLAALAGVRASLRSPDDYTDVNVTGTVRLLEQMRSRGMTRLVFASSSSVYGARRDPPFRESDNVDLSASPYAATKRAGELLCATWHHLYGIQSTCLRFFTVYGPRQRPDMAIHKFARRIRAGASVPMFGEGDSIRDYTYIDDIVDGLVAAIERPLGYRIINLGGGAPVSLRDLIAGVGDALGTAPRIETLPKQPGDVPLTAADITAAGALLDYRPKVPLREGLRRFVAWLEAGEP
jgi:UDP-glucuronate 4-epimerase